MRYAKQNFDADTPSRMRVEGGASQLAYSYMRKQILSLTLRGGAPVAVS